MFGLADTPRPTKPMRGSPRMFKVDWIEKYFSRVRPWHVMVIWGPTITFLAYRAYARGLAVPKLIAAVLLGLFLWTLLEYVLHRFVFHFEPHGRWQEDLSFLIHGIHHDYPWDADRLVMPPTASILIAVALWYPVKISFGDPLFYAVFAGLAAGYVWYDLAHYAFHHFRPRTALGRYLRSYHLIHHFDTPELRYGVSTPLWDYVFGTQPKKGEREAANARRAETRDEPALQ